jgi:hypothetical protein
MRTLTGHKFGDSYPSGYGAHGEDIMLARCRCGLIRKVRRVTDDGRRVFVQLPGGAIAMGAWCLMENGEQS